MKKIILLLVLQFINIVLAKAQFVVCDGMPLEYISQEVKFKSGLGAIDSVIAIPMINHTTSGFAYPLARLVETTTLPTGMTYHGGNHWQVFASSWNPDDTATAAIEFDVTQVIPANYTITFKLYVSNFAPLSVDSCLFSNTLTINLNPVVSVNELNSKNIPWQFSPNPAQDYFEVQRLLATEEDIEIITIQGKTLANYPLISERTRISVSDLENGIYFLKLKKAGTIKKLCILK
jgi:hypothetical protein